MSAEQLNLLGDTAQPVDDELGPVQRAVMRTIRHTRTRPNMRDGTTIRPAPLEDVLEKEWQSQVQQLARTLGWRTYHVYDSRRSTHGFPDLVLVRDRVIYLELKREKGKLTPEQRDWLTAFRDAGSEAYVARPRDLEALAAVLGARSRITDQLETTTREELAA